MKITGLEYKIYKREWKYNCKPLNQCKKRAEEGESGKRRTVEINWAEEKGGRVLKAKIKQRGHG